MSATIKADLHNHTHYSSDSVLSPRRLARWAGSRGLDCVAVTDHNTIRGALAVQELADFQVIVGEEVRTAQGEILGLFLTDEIPRGLSARESVARVREQGGLVGVPHPFDTLRSALEEEEMTNLIEQIDFIEALNARIVFPAHNRRAKEFARRNGLPVSAGSDAHCAWEIGRAYAEMSPFSTPSEFLDSLGKARLTGRLSSPFIHMVSRYAALRRWLGWSPD